MVRRMTDAEKDVAIRSAASAIYGLSQFEYGLTAEQILLFRQQVQQHLKSQENGREN